MIAGYSYELWNGNNVVGNYFSMFPLQGTSVFVPEKSLFKQKYRERTKSVRVPIMIRIISDDGVNVHTRRCLDVRKKSKRQIDILKGEQ